MQSNFNKTSNVSIAVVEEKVTRTAINNYEAHIKQVILSGNAQEEFKKYNYSIPTEFTGMKYRTVIDKHLKKGTKYDKSSLSENDFWVGRTYKRGSGKTTTYVESMTIAPPWKIHPDQLDDFITSFENGYFTDMADFLKGDERFKDCLILDFIVHMDEVYVPESITLEDGTEKMLSETERLEHAYIKPHMHVAYIPTVKAYDEKTGTDYLKLSRKDVWHSDKGFKHSYSEFIDRKHEMVDKHYGFERGELYDKMPEEEKPVHLGLEEWKQKNDQARINRLINQQKKENEIAIERLNKEVQLIQQQTNENGNILEAINEEIADAMEDISNCYDADYAKMDYALLKAERKMFVGILDVIDKIIAPLAISNNFIFEKLHTVIMQVRNKLETNDKVRKNMDKNNPEIDR